LIIALQGFGWQPFIDFPPLRHRSSERAPSGNPSD
jgi:hypothetical protein